MLNIFLKTNIFKHKDVLFVHFGKNLRMLKKNRIASSRNLVTSAFVL